jgi:hypothetical protein
MFDADPKLSCVADTHANFLVKDAQMGSKDPPRHEQTFSNISAGSWMQSDIKIPSTYIHPVPLLPNNDDFFNVFQRQIAW